MVIKTIKEQINCLPFYSDSDLVRTNHNVIQFVCLFVIIIDYDDTKHKYQNLNSSQLI